LINHRCVFYVAHWRAKFYAFAIFDDFGPIQISVRCANCVYQNGTSGLPKHYFHQIVVYAIVRIVSFARRINFLDVVSSELQPCHPRDGRDLLKMWPLRHLYLLR
jgi:hypothetical protein